MFIVPFKLKCVHVKDTEEKIIKKSPLFIGKNSFNMYFSVHLLQELSLTPKPKHLFTVNY